MSSYVWKILILPMIKREATVTITSKCPYLSIFKPNVRSFELVQRGSNPIKILQRKFYTTYSIFQTFWLANPTAFYEAHLNGPIGRPNKSLTLYCSWKIQFLASTVFWPKWWKCNPSMEVQTWTLELFSKKKLRDQKVELQSQNPTSFSFIYFRSLSNKQ